MRRKDAIIVDEVIDEDIDVEIESDEEMIESDGEPMDTYWHFLATMLLQQIVHWQFRRRTRYFLGANMFIYYRPRGSKRHRFKGPDFFYVHGVAKRKRKFWTVWKEKGRFPDVIIELLSPKTEITDLGTKKDTYEQVFRTPEYFCYDPVTRTWQGWRLKNGVYVELSPDEAGRLWSKELGMALGKWYGKFHADVDWFPRFFSADGELLLTEGEEESQRADAEQQLAEQARQLAEQERLRAEEARRLAERERQRAESLQQELDRLKSAQDPRDS